MERIRAKQIFLIVSLKGGVGKSTFAASIAAWLSLVMNYSVGLWDLDITSPSIPKVLGCQGQNIEVGRSLIKPFLWQDKLKVMSVDFMLPDADQPIIFHGVDKADMIRQFLYSTGFGKLDYLVMDSPPSTSEELLTILDLFPASKLNVIFITQPSEVSENGVIKSVRFLTEKGYPIRGIVANMDGMICEDCGHHNNLFNAGIGIQAIADKYEIPYLGEIPIGDGMAEGTNLLNGPRFLEVAQRLHDTTPVRHEEKFTKKSLFAKLGIAMKARKKMARELEN